VVVVIIQSAASGRPALWGALDAPAAEADWVAAVQTLIRNAQEYEADAIIALNSKWTV
jgi:hypothetical protein